MKLPTRTEQTKKGPVEVLDTDAWVGRWVWVDNQPLRIEHVETIVTKTPDPAGGDDIETTTQWVRLKWPTWEVTWRAVFDRIDHHELEKLPEATPEQTEALESARTLVALGEAVGLALSAAPSAIGGGVMLDPDTVERVRALTADLRYAVRRVRRGI